jgi:50S ribosomal subunit-associated GTPase HflX
MFPLDSIDMEKYIFDASKQTWENYISNVKKLLAQSPITTNETIIEEKNNKFDFFDKNSMSEIHENSNNNSFDEKSYGIFSINGDENF